MRGLKSRGFTLIELIMVILILGIISGTLVIFFKPALNSFIAVGRRADMTDNLDTAMRKMMRDVRLAVPNSIRLATPLCAEMVPTITGGRARTGPDIVWDAANPSNTSKPLDTNTSTSVFDLLSPLTTLPSVGDWVVINNQSTNDVYSGINRASIASLGTPPVGAHRITLLAPTQFPTGYDGGRVSIVANTEKAVFYVCDNPGIDVNGTGTGKLYRFSNYGFNAASPSTCPAPVTVGVTTPVLANNIESCSFSYSSNGGATQEAGLLEMQIKVRQDNEAASLSYSAHVDNVP